MNDKHIDSLKNIPSVHFIGIGGISMSGLARLMRARGSEVSGSDKEDSPLIHSLRREGIEVTLGHDRFNVPMGVSLVVHNAAIPEDNVERREALFRGTPIMSRGDFLGLLSDEYTTIAVAGTHGKSTTTAMLACILEEAGLDPTVLVGTLLSSEEGEEGSNVVVGHSRYLLLEACEYERQFLSLTPDVLVITNIEADHLDYYKDSADIYTAFHALALKVPSEGFIICPQEEEGLTHVTSEVAGKVIDYTSTSREGLVLSVFGEHNRRNAECALTVAEVLGVERTLALRALARFRGTWRRSEYKGRVGGHGAGVYDDYAHHPTEIKATLAGMREMSAEKKRERKGDDEHTRKEEKGGRLIAVFQPHLFSRTKDFFEDFACSFKDADEIVFAPIYPAREVDDGSMSSDMLAEETHKHHERVHSFPAFTDIAHYLAGETYPTDTIIIMGAGDVTKLADMLVAR